MKVPLKRLRQIHCAEKAASSETVSPSGLVSTSCQGPAHTAGVVIIIVFISLIDTSLMSSSSRLGGLGTP